MSAQSCVVEFIKQVREKRKICEACRGFYRFFTMSLINTIIQMSKC